MYSDAETAALYDVMYRWDPVRNRSDAFYHRLVMAADAVLDVGCGPGAMLAHARDSGHSGRLVGLDPDRAALDRARRRRRQDIEWIEGIAAETSWNREFDLVVMTGNAFQCFVEDEELHASLLAIGTALRADGRFAFETRHPQARAWEGWSPANGSDVVDESGRKLCLWHEVEDVAGEVVTLTETIGDRAGNVLRVDRARLRFLGLQTLASALGKAGLTIEAQYGDWESGPITQASHEIITIARLGNV